MRAPIAPPPEMADCGAGRAIRARAARALQSLTCPWVGGYATNHADYDDAAALLRRRLTLYPLPPLPSAPRAPINAPPSVPARAAVRCVREEGRKEGRKEERKE